MPQEINWEEQWHLHAHKFHNGFAHIHLNDFGFLGYDEILLKPGPGFGDLSHPTTRLTLRLMAPHIQGKDILDIGCGSGVLSLAANKAGAHYVIGVDIDSAALEHAKENARINQLETCIFVHATQLKDLLDSNRKNKYTVVMNMIRSEQHQAWSAIPQVHTLVETAFTSGIMTEESPIYLRECTDRGWTLMNTIEENGWMAFHFKQFSKDQDK